VTRAELRASVAARLGSVPAAGWVLEEVLGPGPGERPVDPAAADAVERLVARRLAGEPLQYLFGHWPFRTLDLAVDHRVLIPRPETEQLVDVARRESGRLAVGRVPVVVDLGTGSGAIALALAVEGDDQGRRPIVWALDRDRAALQVAEDNRARVAAGCPDVAGRVHLAGGDWWAALPAELAGSIDLAVANPPYVTAEEWEQLEPEVRAEPRGALVAGPGRRGDPGLAAVEAVLDGAARWLGRPAAAVVELAPAQAEAARQSAREAGADEAEVRADLAGRPRVLVARWTEA
jgi:release factor glutamine methyltransferase